MRVVTVAILNAPPEDVWDLLTDWERQASWMPDVEWISVLGEERQLGARLAVRTKVFGVPLMTDRLEVVGWDPPRSLTVRHLALVKGKGEWRLDRRGERTWFLWTEDVSLNVPLIGDLAIRPYRLVLRWTLRRSVRNLRCELERSR
ncbi:MAG TPA: SRPBCC family protein [Actinomycetota bacterium]|nr:SRPBCC family protein [Actinomycetota bacterium]